MAGISTRSADLLADEFDRRHLTTGAELAKPPSGRMDDDVASGAGG